MSGVYGGAAKGYRKAGYFPVPVRGKVSPPSGSTGHVGTVTPEKVKAWRRERGDDNVAIRHDGTVAIDVDDGYSDKHGAATLAQLEAKAGEPLPPTFSSTARGKRSASRQYLYRVPEGVLLATNPGDDVEVCQRHHRYSVVAPSVHPDTGKPYRWYSPDGEPFDGVPPLEDVPFLPDAWIETLKSPFGAKRDPDATVDELLAEARAGDASPAVEECLKAARDADHVGHDVFRDRSYQLLRLALEGHPGVPAAVEELSDLHRAYLIEKGKGGRKANAEVARLLRGAAERAAGEPIEQTYGGTPIELTPKAEPMSLEAAHDAFRAWLGLEYDVDAFDVCLAAYAVQQIGGDPLWALVLSGPGNAKTETVQALAGPGARIVSSIASEGALLSATSKGERTSEATGGLLRELGDGGVLVVKDMTTILSMPAATRGPVLSALREVFDGRWSRTVGTDGGRVLDWAGRVTVVGAVTSAWDDAHAVVSSMGDRFVVLRVDSGRGRLAAGRKALSNTGSEATMREELSAAAAGVLAGADLTAVEPNDEEAEAILAAADLVTRARTHVQTDYRGEVVGAHAPEAPTRFAKQIGQVWRGAVAIGHKRERALRLALRCARDSVPPMRLAVLEDVAAHPGSLTRDVVKRLQKPRTTVDRQLQALHQLELLEVDDTANGLWVYRLAPDVDMAAILPNPFH